MAYQPKSYKKFVATAATATLVASAVVPVAFAAKPATEFSDVAPQYKEAVDYLVDNTIAAGKTPSTFGTAEPIIRVDAAIWIAKATLTEGEISAAPASAFTDVPDRGVIYVDALKSKGYVNGTDATSYNSYANISRGEVAMILAEAYGIEGDAANNTFSDVGARYTAAVAALKDNEITSGKTTTRFGTGDAITRGELAIWVYKLETLTALTVSNVAVAVDASNATVTADVKNAEVDAEATFEVYAGGDLASTPIVKTAKVVDGKVSADFTEVPAGDHVVFVKVGDSSAQSSFTIEGEVVTPDTEAPVLTNAGEATVNVENGAELTLPTVTGTDNLDTEVEVTSVITNAAGEVVEAIDTTVAGTYTVTYSAVDAAGNAAEAVVVTVVVAEAAEVAPMVESVMAITATDVTVVFDKAFETAGEQTLVLVKGDKEYTAKATVAVGDKTAKFVFTTPLTEDGVYTIKDTTLTATLTSFADAAAEKAAVDAVNAASNQVQLLNALNSEFFKNVDADLIAAYRAVLGAGTVAKTTVAEVQTSINTVNAVAAVNAADTQVQLLEALEAGADAGVFTSVRADYIATYEAGLNGNNTLAEIQTVINNAEEAVVTNAENALTAVEAAPTDDTLLADAKTAVAAVPTDIVNADKENVSELFNARLAEVEVVNEVLAADSLSQVRLLTALKANGFTGINEDLIAQYADTIEGNELTVEDIQDDINAGNYIAASEAVNALTNASTTAQFNAAELLLANVAPDGEGETALKDLKADFELTKALAGVSKLTSTSTSTQINTALNALSLVSEEFAANTIAPELRTGIATLVEQAFETDPMLVDEVSEIQTIVVNSAVSNVDTLTATSTNAQVVSALTSLANVTDGFDIDTVNSTLITEYKAALADFDATTTVTDVADIQAIIVGVNDPTNELNAIRDSGTPTDAQLLTLLNDNVLALGNVINANVSEYQADLAEIKSASTIVLGDVAAARAALVEVIAEINRLTEVNGATTATALRTALNKVAVAEDVSSYVDLNSAAKLEVASELLADAPFADTAAIVSALTSEVENRTVLFTSATGVNLGTISEVREALVTYGLESFTDLGASEQVEVAEYLVNNRPTVVTTTTGTYVSGGYTTISQLESAITAAQ